MLWLDPLVMRLGCNKCRGLIGDSYPRKRYHRSATLRLKFRVGRQQRVVRDRAFATSICVTTADCRKRRCRQPKFNAALQFAGLSFAKPASASRPGTRRSNDKPSQPFAGQFLETTVSKIKSARGESQHKLPKCAFRRSAN